MPPASNRVRVFRQSSQHADANGVPTIQTSVPLMLLGFGLFVGIPVTAWNVFPTFAMAATGEATEGGETWLVGTDYRVMLWVTGNLRVFFLGWMCLAAHAFFKRRSAAPRMLIQMYAGAITLNLLEGMWEASFAGDDATYAGQVMGGAVGRSLVAALWSIYLWRSRTVAKVFVYPLPEPAEPLEIVEIMDDDADAEPELLPEPIR